MVSKVMSPYERADKASECKAMEPTAQQSRGTGVEGDGNRALERDKNLEN